MATGGADADNRDFGARVEVAANTARIDAHNAGAG
jgi:hypothetical protein